MAKENLNPIALAEQGIVDFLKSVPAIAGLFSRESAIPVFASTDESASKLFDARIRRSLGQSILVGFTGFTEVVHATLSKQGTFGNGAFNVDIYAPGMLSLSKIKTTSDLAFAVVEALDGVVFAEPFAAPLVLQSWTQEDRDGLFVASLNFKTILQIADR